MKKCLILLALMCYIAVICTKPAPEHEEDDPDHDHHDGHSSEESDETVLLTSEFPHILCNTECSTFLINDLQNAARKISRIA